MKYIVITLISISFLLYCNSEGYKESKQYKEVIVTEKKVESITKRRFLSFNPMFTCVEKVYIVKISNGLSYDVQETFYDNVKVGDKIYLHNGCLCYNKK